MQQILRICVSECQGRRVLCSPHVVALPSDLFVGSWWDRTFFRRVSNSKLLKAYDFSHVGASTIGPVPPPCLLSPLHLSSSFLLPPSFSLAFFLPPFLSYFSSLFLNHLAFSYLTSFFSFGVEGTVNRKSPGKSYFPVPWLWIVPEVLLSESQGSVFIVEKLNQLEPKAKPLALTREVQAGSYRHGS